MTEANYQHMKMIGVAGPYSSSCLPAAIDRISHRAEIQYITYVRYALAMDAQHSLEEAYQQVLNDANAYSPEYYCVEDQETLVHLLKTQARQNHRVIISISEVHSVGLLKVTFGWKMRGTWSPTGDSKTLRDKNVFKYLWQPPIEHTSRYNLMILPPG